MKKSIALMMFTILGITSCQTFGQYTANVNLNTRVSALSDDVTGVTCTAITKSGKAYIAYLDGYFTLKLQLLDANGAKVFDSAGISLESTVTSWSAARTTDILTDNEDNAIVAFWNYVTGEIKVFAVSPTGIVQDTLDCGMGSNPQLEMLPSGAFILAFSNGDSTTIKKLSSSAGAISTIYTRTVNYTCQDMKALPNGNFYMVSFDQLPNPGYAYTYANYINGTTGHPLWTNWASCSSYTNTGLYTALVSCCTDNSKHLYVTNTYFSGMNRTAYAQRIDSSGTVLWGANGFPLISDGVFNYHQRVFSLYNNSTNELLCLINGQNVNDGSNTNKICYQKISQNGTISLSTSGMELVGASANAALFGMGFCGDHVAFTYISEINSNIYASKIDQSGNFLWTPNLLALNTTSNGKSWVNTNLGEIVNDQIIIAFNEARSWHSNVYAQKVGCDGLLPTSVGELNHKVNSIEIYPNPATEKIVIKFSGEQSSDMFVYNLFGELVMQKKLTADKVEIDVSSWSKGIYVLKVSTGVGSVQKKLIKQ